jgi:preprotein translocase subunit SecG
MKTLILFLLILMALFLILLVLVQRGRGGGLAGALGGMGGQSAFGAKAGDTFTKITMWTAFLWIVLCVVAVLVLGNRRDELSTPDGLISRDPVTDTEKGGSAEEPATIPSGEGPAEKETP